MEVFVKNSKSFLLATYYRSADRSNYLPPDLNNNFNEMLGVCIRESKEIIMLGDFNVNFLKKNEHTVLKSYFVDMVLSKSLRIRHVLQMNLLL